MEYIPIIIFILFTFLLILYNVGKKQNHKNFVLQNQETRQKDIKLLESVTSLDRRTWSERDLVLDLLKNDIPAGAIFHDLYIKKPNNKFAQIDLVIATKVGLIVFEVKDYGGWIFGNGRNTQWTQGMRRGQKYRFYNPIMQNNTHINELRKQSNQFKKIPFYSIIVFYGGCELKDISFVPHGTFVTSSQRVLQVVDTIINDNKPAEYTDKYEIVHILKQAVKNGNDPEIQNKHSENIKDMLGKNRVFK